MVFARVYILFFPIKLHPLETVKYAARSVYGNILVICKLQFAICIGKTHSKTIGKTIRFSYGFPTVLSYLFLYKLQFADCKLQFAVCNSQIANCTLQIVYCKLRIANSKLQVANWNCKLQIGLWELQIATVVSG